MPAAIMRKPRYASALQVTRQLVADPERLRSALGSQWHPSSTDLAFLRRFLARAELRKLLDVVDELTPANSTSGSLAPAERPSDQMYCDSLLALSAVWVDLEQFVMQTTEEEEPDAHELYDLLADPHIREVLVAYDDIANSRYATHTTDLVPIYTERDSPISQSSLPRSEPAESPDTLLVANPAEDSLGDVTVISDEPLPPGMTSRSEAPVLVSVAPVMAPKPIPDTSHSSRRANKGSVSELVGRFESTQPSEATQPNTRYRGSKSPRGISHSPGHSDGSKARQLPVEDDSWGSITSGPTARQPPQPVISPVAVAAPVRGMRDESSHSSRRTPSPEKPITTRQKHHVPPATRHSNRPVDSWVKPDSHPSIKSQSESVVSPNGPRSPHAPRGNRRNPSQPPDRSRPLPDSDSYVSASLPKRTVVPHSNRGSHDTQSLNRSNRGSGVRRKPSATRRELPQPGEIRTVRLRREHPGESIGITLAARTPSPPQSANRTQPNMDASGQAAEPGRPMLAIQRIMTGSLADRQGELFPGDIIVEFNGHAVYSLDEVYRLMKDSASALDCTIVVQAPSMLPNGLMRPGLSHRPNATNSKRYIRTLFDYEATKDTLLPTGDCGQSFKAGEVLELMDDQDPNWWQVRPLNDTRGKVRLVPSQTLEERRKAFNQEKAPMSTLKKTKRAVRTFFRAAESSTLRLRADIWVYEEVVPWPQSNVPCVLLLGTTGVGRRNLKVLLVEAEPNRFAFPLSDTTNPAAPSSQFSILPRFQMDADVKAGAYVEWGEVDGHLYGIRFSAIRKIIASGRTVVMDCLPHTVHLLHQPEFNPCTVMVAAPNLETARQMMTDGLRAGVTKNNRSDDDLSAIVEQSERFARENRHLYWHHVTNSDMGDTVDRVIRLITRIERQPGWIPSGWAYELTVPGGSASFVPGSSSLSALGIQGLPTSRPSVIARSIFSGISEASSESAFRMARPPQSIISSTEGRGGGGRGRGGLYERRRKPQHGRQQQQQQRVQPAPIPERETASESELTNSHGVESSTGRRKRPQSNWIQSEVQPVSTSTTNRSSARGQSSRAAPTQQQQLKSHQTDPVSRRSQQPDPLSESESERTAIASPSATPNRWTPKPASGRPTSRHSARRYAAEEAEISDTSTESGGA